MNRSKKLKIKYNFIEPKTLEEREKQQKILSQVYEILFKTPITDKEDGNKM